MATAASLTLDVWRNDDVYEFPLRVRGPDLTGIAMRAQVRLAPDTPGAPLIDLALTTNGNAEGIRLAGVTTVNGVIANDVRIRLNKSTRQAMPYGGERGDAAVLAFAFQIAGRTRLYGNMRILASAIDSDGAPASRPPSYGARIGNAPAGGAQLTIADDDVVVLTIDGADLIGPLVSGAEEYAVRAETAADRVESIRPNIVPVGNAAVAGNTMTATEYVVAVPEGFEPLPNGALIDFIVPETSLGLVFLTIGGVPIREMFLEVGQKLRAGWTARVRKNDGGGKWNLVHQTPDGISLIAVEDVLAASYQVLSQVLGVPIAKPLSDNPNEFFVDFPIWANDAVFEAYIVETNTAAPIINLSSGYRRAVLDAPAGALQAGTIAKFQISFGVDNVFYRTSRPGPSLGEGSTSPAETDLIAKFVSDFHAEQWNLDGTPVPFVITTAGNSLSTKITGPGEPDREGAAVYPISARITDLLNGFSGTAPSGIPTASRVPGTRVIDDNQSFGGKTLNNFTTQLGASTYYASGQTRAVIINPGPNDWREGNYNTGQQFPPGMAVVEEIILTNRAKGIPTIIVVPADPDPTQNDHAKFYTDNLDIAQNYPTAVSAPVDPETEQYPPASQSVGAADMTGHGVPIPFDRRFEHGAAACRVIAAKYPKCVILIDKRKAAHRTVEALQPDAYSKGLLFAPGDAIHHLPYLADRAEGFPAIDFAQDLLAGGPMKQVYDGGEWRNYGASA